MSNSLLTQNETVCFLYSDESEIIFLLNRAPANNGDYKILVLKYSIQSVAVRPLFTNVRHSIGVFTGGRREPGGHRRTVPVQKKKIVFGERMSRDQSFFVYKK